MFLKPLSTIRHKIYTPADVRNELMISNERPSSPRQQPDSPPKPLDSRRTPKSLVAAALRCAFALKILQQRCWRRFLNKETRRAGESATWFHGFLIEIGIGAKITRSACAGFVP
jgi:hypothetical protein